ncbi:MAG: ABC transporter permease [Chloroflexi bacterium]|nr:ABC transporter permease [Chloroflexota bacterium]
MNFRKLWLVARTTYLGQVRSTTFLVMTFVLPLIVVVVAAVPILLDERDSAATYGLVDLSGALDPSTPVSGEEEISLQRYDTEADAEQARVAGTVEGYLVVAADYLAEGTLAYHGAEAPDPSAMEGLERALRYGLAPEAPPWLHERLAEPAIWQYEALAKGARLDDGFEVTLWAMAPIALSVLFALMLTTTLNGIAPAIMREREERSMEMVLTSLRPVELVGGKLLGLSLLTITQAGIWLLAAAVALALVWINQGTGGWPDVPWHVLGWAVMLCVPGYLLYGSLAAGLGVISGGREQARQITGLLAILAVSPIWMLTSVMKAPLSPASTILSVIPTFAPVLALFRMSMAEVPPWQLWLAAVLLWVSVALAIAAVARLFRASALLYGQILSPRGILSALGTRKEGAA